MTFNERQEMLDCAFVAVSDRLATFDEYHCYLFYITATAFHFFEHSGQRQPFTLVKVHPFAFQAFLQRIEHPASISHSLHLAHQTV